MCRFARLYIVMEAEPAGFSDFWRQTPGIILCDLYFIWEFEYKCCYIVTEFMSDPCVDAVVAPGWPGDHHVRAESSRIPSLGT